jgi:xylulokinase
VTPQASPLLLGIDVGTSGLKSVLIGLDGRIVACAMREYEPDTPRAGWAEQAPDVWVQAAIATVREVLAAPGVDPAAVASIGFSGQMHSAVMLDAAGAPVRPAILWLDTRSAPQVKMLGERFGTESLAAWIGNPIMTGVTLASLLWLKTNETDSWARIAHVMLSKDYVRYRLTGNIDTDYSDASATAMFDVGKRRWSSELLEPVGLPVSWLPPLAASSETVGYLRPEITQTMGLRAGIPVGCGAGDQEAQAIGNGILRPGLLSSTIGTGGQLFMPADSYRCDPALRLHTFCHSVPGRWHWLAATLTAGMSLRWLRDHVLAGRYSYAEIADAAASVEPGAEGLVFLPYLAGERTPHLDPHARGVFF